MLTRITHTSIVVRDQDEALAFYTAKLGFEKFSDAPMGPNARWLTVKLPGDGVELILEQYDWYDENESTMRNREELIGRGSVVLSVDDCRTTYEVLSERGVEFTQEPTAVPWGIEAVAKDLYGNMLVMVQASA